MLYCMNYQGPLEIWNSYDLLSTFCDKHSCHCLALKSLHFATKTKKKTKGSTGIRRRKLVKTPRKNSTPNKKVSASSGGSSGKGRTISAKKSNLLKTPKTTKGMSPAVKARFKREKTGSKKISYQHRRRKAKKKKS